MMWLGLEGYGFSLVWSPFKGLSFHSSFAEMFSAVSGEWKPYHACSHFKRAVPAACPWHVSGKLGVFEETGDPSQVWERQEEEMF